MTVDPVPSDVVRIGTRGSRLARWQADWCAEQLRQAGVGTEIVVIRTHGDLVRDESIVRIGAPGVFTKEIQQALLDKEIDLAVHSLKDLPTEPVDGLVLSAVPKRGPCFDALLSNGASSLDDLPDGSRIGTGSLRRKTQIAYRFGDRFHAEEIRGNVETRIRKLDAGEYDALILAEAGLVRLGLADRICTILDPPLSLPAVGQGALGLEIRSEDRLTSERIASLSDDSTFAAVLAERAFLRVLQGGCIAPIAAWGHVDRSGDGAKLTLHGRILSLDGRQMFETTRSVLLNGFPDTPFEPIAESLGKEVADQLLRQGADRIIEEIRQLRRA